MLYSFIGQCADYCTAITPPLPPVHSPPCPNIEWIGPFVLLIHVWVICESVLRFGTGKINFSTQLSDLLFLCIFLVCVCRGFRFNIGFLCYLKKCYFYVSRCTVYLFIISRGYIPLLIMFGCVGLPMIQWPYVVCPCAVSICVCVCVYGSVCPSHYQLRQVSETICFVAIVANKSILSLDKFNDQISCPIFILFSGLLADSTCLFITEFVCRFRPKLKNENSDNPQTIAPPAQKPKS